LDTLTTTAAHACTHNNLDEKSSTTTRVKDPSTVKQEEEINSLFRESLQ